MCSDLTVVCCYFNPGNFQSHRARYQQFAAHMQASGVRLVTVECVFPTGRVLPTGEMVWQEYQVTNPGHPDHVQVNSRTPLWLKENLLNLGWSRCTTPFVMWSDTDMHFEDTQWVKRTLWMLETVPVVQPYSLLIHRGPANEPLCQCRTFAASQEHQYATEYLPHITVAGDCNGGAWAFRRAVINATGGLFDEHVMGDGDDVLAFALGHSTDAYRPGMHATAVHHLWRWSLKMASYKFGVVNGLVNHQWHGPIRARGYSTRWKILTDADFNPDRDLVRNVHGVWECNNALINARVTAYFLSRCEDQ